MSRSALVTGASSGIGLAVASVLAGAGYDLTVVGRDRAKLDAAVVRLSAFGTRVNAVELDVVQSGSGERLVQAHRQCFGRLDCVLVSAGGSLRAALTDTEGQSLRRLLSVHVESAFDLTRAALPSMRRDPGTPPSWLILMSSMAGIVPAPEFAAYSAAKAAVVSLARSINREEGERGVRACALCPGFVDTPLTAPLRESVRPEEMIRPADVAEAVRFLLALSPTTVVSQILIERVGAEPFQP